jgi:hypothetical protein
VLEIFQENMQIGKVSNRLKYDAQDHLEKCEGIKKLQMNIRELLDLIKSVNEVVK